MEAMEQVGVTHDTESPEPAAMGGEVESTPAAGRTARHPLSWDNYIRSLFLLFVTGTLACLAYPPGMIRMSMIWSFASPSQGESLNWKPNPAPPEPEREIITSPIPSEWRLNPGYSVNRAVGDKADTKFTGLARGVIAQNKWSRFSVNPWTWRDNVSSRRKDEALAFNQPPQKSASPFRAGEYDVWPETRPDPVVAVTPATPFTPMPASQPGALVSAIPPLESTLPVLNAAPQQPAEPMVAVPAIAAGEPLPPLGALQPIQSPTVPETPIVSAPGATAEPAQPRVDWKNTEITGPIPGAYLTIYPKLKFVGLCVPGQGYIRKYNRIGVPSDLANPKMSARDGRTPYGRYYIAERHRDGDGARLYISWPSPEDAKRIGLDAGSMAQVANAWRRQELPPQDTAAGGGVGLNGLRNWVDVTEGGFALEEPHMEEIFTALPDKSWVFIQE